MNKAIRIAIAAAFGVATTLPAYADFENNGPSDKQGKGTTSLSEVNPPALDGNPVSALADFRTNRQFRSDRMYSSTDTSMEPRTRHYGHHARADNQIYGNISEPGSMSEPGMRSGEFNWDHYTTGSSRDSFGS